jgi:hypothetical protein
MIQDKYARESGEEAATVRAERGRERGDRPEKENTSAKGITFIGGTEAPRDYKSEGTSQQSEPGLVKPGNFSNAVKFLNKSVERGEHSPEVCGHKNDYKTH